MVPPHSEGVEEMMEFGRPMLLACTAIPLVFASPAFAQSTDENEENAAVTENAAGGTNGESQAGETGTAYLSPITVFGSSADNPYETAGPVSRITADEIEQFGSRDVDNVIRATPGASTRDNPQNPGIAVNIRGFEGSGRVNMMVDGVRQNFRFTGHEAQGFLFVDPAFISGIEIDRGYVSGVGGGNTLMGSVNFSTYDVDDLIDEGENYGGLATITFGTNNAGFSESLIGAYRFDETFAVLGGISKRDPGNYENGSGETVDFSAEDEVAGLVKLEITPLDDHRLELGANFYNNDFASNSYRQTIDSKILTANYAYTPDNNWVDLRINGYYSRLNMFYHEPIDTGSSAGRDITDTGYGFDISNTSYFDAGDLGIEVNYGFEYFADDYDVINSAADPNAGVNGSGKSANYSLFASTRLSYGIADLILDLRYDHSNLTGSGSMAATNPYGMPAGPYEVDSSEGRINPRVTLALTPVPWFQPYVTYSHTSRPPTISETFVGGQHPGSTRQSFYPNPFLESEKSRGWEVGANFNFADILLDQDHLSLKANYFHNRIEDYIVGNMAFVPGSGFQVYFDNVPGTSTVQGVELQAAYDSGGFFGSLAFTYTDSDLPSQVNGFGAQSYMPERVLTATVGARFLDQKLTVGARAHAVSESYIGEINVAAGADPYDPGYSIFDIFANYRFDNGLELSANVANLFDKSYTPALSTAPAIEAEDIGRGRTLFLTAQMNF